MVDKGGAPWRLSDLGHHLGKMPVDARLGRMLIYGAVLGCLDPVYICAYVFVYMRTCVYVYILVSCKGLFAYMKGLFWQRMLIYGAVHVFPCLAVWILIISTKFSKVCSVLRSHIQFSRKLTFENFYRAKVLGYDDKFSKVSSVVILYCQLQSKLTFENVYSGVDHRRDHEHTLALSLAL